MRFVIVTMALWATAAHAQLFKCEVNGKVEYRDAPCAQGKDTRIGGSVTTMDAMPRDEINRAMQPPAPPPEREANITPKRARVDSYECQVAQKNLGIGINAESKMRSQRQYEIACFGEEAADIEKARASVPPPRHVRHGPAVVTNCDAGGCWDSAGQRYNRAAGGNFFSQDGRFCQRVGDQLQCH